MATVLPKVAIMSTAGAVPVKNEKGQVSMEKVKVSRYISGKRPDYAPDSSEEDEEIEISVLKQKRAEAGLTSANDAAAERIDADDRRLRRLQERRREELDSDDEDREARVLRHRQLVEPEVLDESEEETDTRRFVESGGETSEEEEELDDEEIERRREMLRIKMKGGNNEEVLDLEEEKEIDGGEADDDAGGESSEYEEYSGSEEEDCGPRLKPVFVRKKDRITIQQKEKEREKEKDLEYETKKLKNERRQQTLKMVEAEIKRDLEAKKLQDHCDAIESGEENDEEEYEAWKVRELRRLKRDREEREAIEKDKQEIERFHNMTEEERRQEQKANPKIVTNKAAKGKYKFLQKYYHRGVFFLDKEDTVYKRDYSEPTLEDHFNKTVLPKVMQVKNFGRSGRTKYTHLVDQDTTHFESPWIADTAQNLKFHTNKGGGMRQSFERPTVKRK